MEPHGFLDFLPLWLLFTITLSAIVVAVEAGYRLGRFRRLQAEPEKEASVGAMVGATLGLLAFMLAFTFGLAATRFDDRRQIVVEEANAIGTAYLRAEMLAEPHRSEIRRLIREYVDIRLKAPQPGMIEVAITRSTELHSQLWAEAVEVARRDQRSIISGLFIESLNEVIDLHAKRVMLALRSRIAPAIWLALGIVAILAMVSIGYHEGLTSIRRTLAVPPLIITFSTVMLLIADLDRPREGLMVVSQQSMLDLQHSFDISNPGVQRPTP